MLAVLNVFSHAPFKILFRGQGVSGSNRDRASGRIRNEGCAAGHEEMVLVTLDCKGGQGMPAVCLEDARDCVLRRFLTVSQNHWSEQKQQKVNARQPPGNLERLQEPCCRLGVGICAGCSNQYPGTERFVEYTGVFGPRVLLAPVAQPNASVNKNHKSENRHHQDSTPKRCRVTS